MMHPVKSIALEQLPALIAQAKEQQSTGQRLCVVLDGFAAAGKTTVAAALSRQLKAPVVHMDDFFLPPELRTAQRLSQPGGNVHYERFRQQVAPWLHTPTAFCYQRLDCRQLALTETVEIPASSIILVEGAYGLLPACGALPDLSVLFTISPSLQQKRILARNGPDGWQQFRHRWIPLEQAYANAYHLERQVDYLVCAQQE